MDVMVEPKDELFEVSLCYTIINIKINTEYA